MLAQDWHNPQFALFREVLLPIVEVEESQCDSKNKVALITGAGGGIGYQTALRFSQEGASIVAVDINEEGGLQCVADIGQRGGAATYVYADVTLRRPIARR